MKKLSEGKRMWGYVMGIFLVYAGIFILFDDYDKHFLQPFVIHNSSGNLQSNPL